MPNDRGDKKMISPIRESLIQNSAHFILGNKNNASNSNVGVGGTNLSSTNDTSILGGIRERSEERRPLNPANLLSSEMTKKEKDVLDDFMSPSIPKQ